MGGPQLTKQLAKAILAAPEEHTYEELRAALQFLLSLAFKVTNE
jgi:hypothetical protein